ncbi:MAG: HEPN domain-containing protein [Planctomycetes bacterium]|nr:HEPN domain-containing protein [Planctomycetota bacterium]
MKGEQFLESARLLVGSAGCEAGYRSAVSRSYYAAFLELHEIAFRNCIREVRLRAGIRNIKGIRHNSILDYLTRSTDAQVKAIGRKLANLQQARIDADYDLTIRFDQTDAQIAIASSESILASIVSTSSRKFGEAMESFIGNVFKGPSK